jgi:virulence-associated protein VagC
MKKQAFGTITMLSFLLVLAAVSVNAQRLSDNSIAVNIPFDFAFGETKLPVGNYTLRRIVLPSSYDRLVIQSADGRGDTHTVMTGPNRTSEVPKQSNLVFNRYGDQYFLSQVWMAASDTGRDLFQSRNERNLAKESKLARSKSEHQKVVLTAGKR